MDENLESGFCTYCGNKVINENISKVKVAIDRSSEVVNTLSLAKSYLYDKDLITAQNLLRKVMEVDSRNSDVWYMDAVLDSKNRNKDLQRAKKYPSLGIFTEKDYRDYKHLVFSERGKVAYLILFTFGFLAIFGTLVPSLIFGIYWLPVLVIGIVVTVAIVIKVMLGRSKRVIADPTLSEAHDSALSHVTEDDGSKPE